MKDSIVELIINVANELNDELEQKISVEQGANAPLFGKDGVLDSLGLVTLIVAVEQAIEDKFDISVTLADEKALSQKNSPFLKIGSLAEYAEHLIRQGQE